MSYDHMIPAQAGTYGTDDDETFPIVGWDHEGKMIVPIGRGELITETVVPATPGWCLLEGCPNYYGEGKFGYVSHTVIAWKMQTRWEYLGRRRWYKVDRILPVIPDYTGQDLFDFATLRPDGTVYIFGDRDFNSIEEWVKEEEERIARERGAAKEKA